MQKQIILLSTLIFIAFIQPSRFATPSFAKAMADMPARQDHNLMATDGSTLPVLAENQESISPNPLSDKMKAAWDLLKEVNGDIKNGHLLLLFEIQIRFELAYKEPLLWIQHMGVPTDLPTSQISKIQDDIFSFDQFLTTLIRNKKITFTDTQFLFMQKLHRLNYLFLANVFPEQSLSWARLRRFINRWLDEHRSLIAGTALAATIAGIIWYAKKRQKQINQQKEEETAAAQNIEQSREQEAEAKRVKKEQEIERVKKKMLELRVKKEQFQSILQSLPEKLAYLATSTPFQKESEKYKELENTLNTFNSVLDDLPSRDRIIDIGLFNTVVDLLLSTPKLEPPLVNDIFGTKLYSSLQAFINRFVYWQNIVYWKTPQNRYNPSELELRREKLRDLYSELDIIPLEVSMADKVSTEFQPTVNRNVDNIIKQYFGDILCDPLRALFINSGQKIPMYENETADALRDWSTGKSVDIGRNVTQKSIDFTKGTININNPPPKKRHRRRYPSETWKTSIVFKEKGTEQLFHESFTLTCPFLKMYFSPDESLLVIRCIRHNREGNRNNIFDEVWDLDRLEKVFEIATTENAPLIRFNVDCSKIIVPQSSTAYDLVPWKHLKKLTPLTTEQLDLLSFFANELEQHQKKYKNREEAFKIDTFKDLCIKHKIKRQALKRTYDSLPQELRDALKTRGIEPDKKRKSDE